MGNAMKTFRGLEVDPLIVTAPPPIITIPPPPGLVYGNPDVYGNVGYLNDLAVQRVNAASYFLNGVAFPPPPTLPQALWGIASAPAMSIPTGGANTSFTGFANPSANQTLAISTQGINVPAPLFTAVIMHVGFIVTPATSPATGTAFQINVTTPVTAGFTFSPFPIIGIGDTTNGVSLKKSLLLFIQIGGTFPQPVQIQVSHRNPAALSMTCNYQLFLLNNAWANYVP